MRTDTEGLIETGRLATLLREAYARQGTAHFCGEVEGYCENQACDAREVRITVKADVEGPPAETAHCPLCGARLKIHGVRTFQEVVETFRLSCAPEAE